MWGAHVAGRAINLSKTTAAHALSYQLTTRFGLAHGLAVALTLGHVATFNAGVTDADCTHPGGIQRVRTLVAQCCANTLRCTPVEMPDRMRSLLRELNLPDTLQSAVVTRDALQPMAATADTVRLSNNPRRLTTELAAELLHAAF
jgi:alcohol dehydrogenase class IV